MSQQLINAASDGNIQEVLRLLSQPNTDINFIGSYLADRHNACDKNRHKEKVTALSAAILSSKWDMAKLLIAQGAMISDPSCESYVSAFATPYLAAITKDNIDLDVMKLILAKVKVLNPKFSGWGILTVASYLTSYNKRQLALYLFHEAILRDDENTMDELISSKSHLPVNDQSFTEYLNKRTLTVQDAFLATKAINHLVDKSHILKNNGEAIKAVINKEVKFELRLEVFPEVLKSHLSQQSKRTLTELFCELQAWLYPEENLPRVSIDSEGFQRMDQTQFDKSVEQLRGRQNISNLRSFLDLDQASILMRLSNCTSESGENPAALLLAEILLYHGEAKIQPNPDMNPVTLLSQKQQAAGLNALNSLFSLTTLEKLLLSLGRHQFISMTEISQQNAILLDDILNTKNEVIEMSDRYARMEKKLDSLLIALMSKNDNQQSEAKRPVANTMFSPSMPK